MSIFFVGDENNTDNARPRDLSPFTEGFSIHAVEGGAIDQPSIGIDLSNDFAFVFGKFENVAIVEDMARLNAVRCAERGMAT